MWDTMEQERPPCCSRCTPQMSALQLYSMSCGILVMSCRRMVTGLECLPHTNFGCPISYNVQSHMHGHGNEHYACNASEVVLHAAGLRKGAVLSGRVRRSQKLLNTAIFSSGYMCKVTEGALCSSTYWKLHCMQLERGEVGNGTVTSMKESVGFVKQVSQPLSACKCNCTKPLEVAYAGQSLCPAALLAPLCIVDRHPSILAKMYTFPAKTLVPLSSCSKSCNLKTYSCRGHCIYGNCPGGQGLTL